MPPTGTKSASGSYGSFLNSAALTAVAFDNSASVWPSGGEASTALAAATPPPVGWFSMTIWVPRRGSRRPASSRSEISETAPAGNGETIRIAREGNLSWAATGHDDDASQTSAEAAHTTAG